MFLNIDIRKTTESYENELRLLKSRLKSLPKAHICSRKRHGKYYYWQRTKNVQGKSTEKYLGASQKQFIEECCEAAYLRRLIPALEKELKSLREFEKKYDPSEKYNAWNRLPEGYKPHIEPLFRDDQTACRDWEYENFPTNSFPLQPENRYISRKNEAVRSRIELIVADMLNDLGIPYRYECRLDLPSGPVYPDFTVMHPTTHKIYYIEIFGMMDSPEYERAAFAKIAKYTASDAYQDLIMFFDHKYAPISPAHIKNTLIRMFKDEEL